MIQRKVEQLVPYESGGRRTAVIYILVSKEKVKKVKEKGQQRLIKMDILLKKVCGEWKMKANKNKVWRLKEELSKIH